MKVKIDKTFNTPSIDISPGYIEIQGRSIPEDSFEFYIPVIEHITNYLKGDILHTKVVIYLEYINSSSKKFLTNILNLLEKSYLKGKQIELYWQYDEDDEAIYDLGNDFRSFIKIPITMQEIL